MPDLELSDTQLMLLSQASQREDLLLVFPETLKGGAVKAVVSKLLTSGLVAEVSVAGGEPAWRKQDDQRPIGLKLTRAGLEALGLGPDHEGSSEERPSETVPTDTAGLAAPKPASARDGSKRAKVIELLSREAGASLDDLVGATGWLPHTTRAALTGLRQRGYVLAKTKGEGGRGVYRITSTPDQASTASSSRAEA